MEINTNKKIKNILKLNKKSKCPHCKKIAEQEFFPFCSKKCSNLDLMKWLNDEYQVFQKSD
tara:strand:- start:404 stop:586 length:183 start_codon:yes stop_codon:yes gene_type:complete